MSRTDRDIHIHLGGGVTTPLADITDFWAGDPFRGDAGDTRVRAGRDNQVLEGIRHARVEVPALCDEVRRLRDELDRGGWVS